MDRIVLFLKRTLLSLVFFIVIGSCEQAIDRRFDQIEQDLSFQPDSAYAKLSGISIEGLRPESRRARYALLMSLARDKSYIDVADDSLVQIAVNYYQRHGSAHEIMLALYSLGRVQRNAKNNTGAIISFLQAKELAEELSDYHYIGLSSWNIAGLYGECNDEDTELRYYQESKKAFFIVKEESNAFYSQFGEARVYMSKGLSTTADSVLNRVEEFARNNHDGYLLSQLLKDKALNLLTIQSPNPRNTITLYKEASNLGLMEKETVDYGALALAYEMINIPDSVTFFLNLANNVAKTTLDSAHLYNTLIKIYNNRGNYRAANEMMKNGVDLHNRLIYNRENLQIANAISSYNQQKAIRQSEIAHYRQKLNIISLIALLALFCVLILVIINRKRQIQEKNRIIREKEQKIEDDIANIQEVSEQLRNVRDNQSEMAKTIKDLISEKIAIVKQCADAYEAVKNEPRENPRDPYRYLDVDPVKKKTEEINNFLQALDRIRNDDTLFSVLEESVNKWHGDIMVKLRLACAKETMRKPKFDENDFRILMLIYAGIPDRTISFLMDMTCSAVRTRKMRYKERLIQEDISNGAFFVQEMAGNSKE